MESVQQETAVHEAAQEVAQTEVASLRGITGNNGSYIVCIVNEADVAPDDTFTTTKALTFETIDKAIAGLQNLIDHAKQAQYIAAMTNAYQQGFAAREAQDAACQQAPVEPAIEEISGEIPAPAEAAAES